MRFVVMLTVPWLLFSATREACTERYERFRSLEAAYDAVVEAKIASPVAVEVIEAFRKEGGEIYRACRDRLSTSTWYMLGKKVEDRKVDIAKFRLQSLEDLKRYALTHPPVVTKVLCGTVTQGGRLPQPRRMR